MANPAARLRSEGSLAPLRLALAVYLASVSHAQHQHHQLLILDVVDHPVLTYSDAALSITTAELDIPLRARVSSEIFDGFLDPQPVTGVDLAESFRRRGLIRDRLLRH